MSTTSMTPEFEQTAPTRTFVRDVQVVGLFGRYNYTLRSDPSIAGAPLMIFYGDNGCGKTTVLRLLFHTLSQARLRGHKTFLARTPFKSFKVVLTTGWTLNVTREAEFQGTFTMQALKDGHIEAQATFLANEEMVIPRDQHTPGEEELHKALQRACPAISLLGDDRDLDSDLIAQQQEERVRRMRAQHVTYTGTETAPTSADKLITAIDRAERWMRQQALQAAHAGDRQMQHVYRDIAERISRSETGPETEPETILRATDERSKSFARYGLLEQVQSDELIEVFKKAPSQTRTTLWNVISSYADGLAARMDALEETKHLYELFVTTINKFLVDKEIDLQLRRGITIRAGGSGQRLSPTWLSSGERHLILLMCTTLAAREVPTIFLIDEPELSLNVKWQRDLVGALLGLTDGSNVQFIFATHSIQLLTQHQSSVVKMTEVAE